MLTTAPPLPPEAPPRRQVRRGGLAAALWIFSVATTLLLIGLWGRSIAGDEVTLEASARAAVNTEVVTDRVAGWLADGISAVSSLTSPEVAATVEEIARLPEARAALDLVISQIVAAALAEPGTAPEIDIGSALLPLAPTIAHRLDAAGLRVSQVEVESALATVDSVALATEPQAGFAGVAVEARAALTRVVLAAALTMLVSGLAVIALANERLRMFRSLLIRVAVSAATFAVILRLGAWAVDPAGGGSPVAAGGGVLLASNGWFLVLIAVGTGTAAAAGGWATRRRLVGRRVA